MKLLIATLATVLMMVLAVGLAAGDERPTRSATLSTAAERYSAFARPQSPDDVFRSESDTLVHQRAAENIAATSRRVYSDEVGDAFVFLNDEDELCILWTPVSRSVAGSSCGDVNSESPGVAMGADEGRGDWVVAGLLSRAVRGVSVERRDGRQVEVPVRDSAYVYRGPAPFTIIARSTNGKQTVLGRVIADEIPTE